MQFRANGGPHRSDPEGVDPWQHSKAWIGTEESEQKQETEEAEQKQEAHKQVRFYQFPGTAMRDIRGSPVTWARPGSRRIRKVEGLPESVLPHAVVFNGTRPVDRKS
jgi:hypothetical protein